MDEGLDDILDDACLYLLASRRLSRDFLRSSDIEISSVLCALRADDVRMFGDITAARTELESLIACGRMGDVERMARIWRQSRV